METKGNHTNNRKYRRYGMRGNEGNYLVQCPFCDNNYTVSTKNGCNFVCSNCGGTAGLQHVIKELVNNKREMHDIFAKDYVDERTDLREAGNNSDVSYIIRESIERFICAVSNNDKKYILENLKMSALSSSMDEEQRFLRFKRSAIGRYLGNKDVGLQDAIYLSGYPWPSGYDYLQEKLSEIDRDGDGIPDDDIRGYQHYEVILTDGEAFDVYLFEEEDGKWKLRIL